MRLMVWGGWYIGGDFEQADTFQRDNLVHVLPSGEVDPAFNIPTNNEVLALERSGQRLYLGGKFTEVTGLTRNRIAAINLNTNALANWDPSADQSGLKHPCLE